MEQIPISFEHNGRRFAGHFSPVYGGGNHQWHLIVDSFYFGRLRLTEGQQWVFDPTPKTEGLESLSEFFGDYLRAWIE
ncbi:MAG: hypothetical protein ACO1OO_08600 [Flavisolibacter sp.]